MIDGETLFLYSMVNVYSILKDKFSGSSERSQDALKGVVLSVLAKLISVASSLLIVPLTIDYVNPTQYGIWLTLSSIIGWITFFDLGLGNGFRNRFSEAKANDNNELARSYLSTTYFAVSAIVSIVFIFVFLGNWFVDWAVVLNVDPVYKDELGTIFIILSAFFCLNMVANIFCTMLMADQKAGTASLVQGSGQFLSLVSIWLLTKVSQGSLTNLALYFAGVPCMFTVIISLVAYSTKKYRVISPHIRYVELSLIKDLMGLGIQFFLIYVCMIFIFQIINIVIAREFGPDVVTEYNIAYKYFFITHMLMNILVVPFWSAFTDAYQKNDYMWMKKVIRILERFWILSVFLLIVMYVLSNWAYTLWIGSKVSVEEKISVIVAIYAIISNISTIYLNLINGIGSIRIQLIIYCIFAILSWPLMIIFSHSCGIVGVIMVPIVTLIFQAIIGKIQINKITNQTANGIWLK